MIPAPDFWLPTPARAASLPAPGEVDLWRIDLRAGNGEEDLLVLSAEERNQAARYLDPAGRRRYARTRAALRRLLGQCLGADPVLRLEAGPSGKPFLAPAPGRPDLHFNVSHSGEIALVALAVGRSIGVDLEGGARKADLAAIAGRWFTAEEQNAWRAEGAREAAFFRIWTRKEAVLKAHGGGLAAGMTGFSVAAPLDGKAVLWPPGVVWEGTPYVVLDLEPGPGAVGALAVAGARTLPGVRRYALA